MNSVFSPNTKLPHHLAIIPDGNRRWAKEHGLPTLQGHLKGFSALLQMARAAREWGIHTVTIWIFSTENWKRDKREVDYLMKIEEKMIRQYLPELKKDKVRIIHLGRKDRIPASFKKTLEQTEKETAANTRHVLNIAVDYGGRDEIIRAINKWRTTPERSHGFTNVQPATFQVGNQRAKRTPPPKDTSDGVRMHSSEVDGLTEEIFSKFLDTANQPYPNPDLLIRTSGEMRTSGLLPWQMVYTEFYFLKKHLPDCTTDDLKKAILEYSKRQRRFGGN